MRRTLAAAGALAVVLGLAACSSSAPAPSTSADASRPNIVFVLTDDLSWNLVSRMPHVVGLQKAGLTMSKYYVTDSLCCPSRSAIFTGEFAHDNGVFTNSGADGGYGAYMRNGDAKKSFAVALQKAGYTTGFMGKYLNGYLPKGDAPGPGWTDWDVAGNGYPEFDYDLNENGKVQHYGSAPGDYLVDVMSRKGADFIDHAADARKPFMLELATFAPHAPYTPAPRYVGTETDVPYPRTPAYDALPTNAPSWLGARQPLTAANEQLIRTSWSKRLEADRAVDDLIGTVEHELKAKGVEKNTYIVFSSDNGYHMGEYRLLPGKQTAYDTDIHVPLIVAGPGVHAGTTSTALAANVDLCPTFETLGGAPVGSSVDGVSLAGLWHGESTPSDWQKALLVEHHGPDDTKGDPDRQSRAHADPPSYDAVRTADALYVKYADGSTEYYDTTTDPYELDNIAGNGVPASLPSTLAAQVACHGATECQAAARG